MHAGCESECARSIGSRAKARLAASTADARLRKEREKGGEGSVSSEGVCSTVEKKNKTALCVQRVALV